MAYTFKVSASTRRYRAYRTHRSLATAPVVILFTFCFLAASIVTFLQYFGLIETTTQLIGLTVATASLGSAFLLIYVFATTYFPYLPLTKSVAEVITQGDKAETNVAEVASFLLIGTIGGASRHQTQQGLKQAFRALLKVSPVLVMLNRLQFDRLGLIDAVEQEVIPNLTWSTFAELALQLANNLEATEISVEHAMAVFLVHPSLQTYLRQHDLNEQDIQFVIWWTTAVRESRQLAERWWDADRLLSFMGVGLSWTSGFTPLIDRFSRIPQGNLWDQIILGRYQYVDQLITTLARQRQSNVLLVGQPGVGRLGIIQELARRVNQGQAHPELNGQRVVYIHIGELLALSSSAAGQLAAVSQALNEIERAGNIIAVIDGLGSILGKSGEQRVNLTEVLLPFFSSLAVRVAVIISSDEYHLRLKNNQELLHFFEVVQVPSASSEVTLRVLALAAPSLEQRLGINLPYKSLRAITEGTEDLLQHIPFPERAFDVLEEVLVLAQSEDYKQLTIDLVNALISRKVGVPIGRIAAQEREHLLNLEEIMHHRIVNQDRAVSAVARAMIRARAGVRNKKRPIGTFLFLGPTGVGKTETAKTLAEAYFGSEDYMNRLDMSEFQGPDGVAGLIGSTEQPVGRLTSLISDKPFTVLLLDEFEKAHLNVQQLFLQEFDESRLTDVRGQNVSFKHAIMIATSNAGAEFIHQNLAAGPLPNDFDKQLRNHILEQKIFRPELLNRFDGVITFTPLSTAHVRQISALMMNKLNKRLDDEHGVTVAVTEELKDFRLEIGYNPEFGARPMARAIQDTVEYAMAQKVLKGELEPGQEITLAPETLRAILPK